MCNKEDGWRHILRCEETRNWTAELVDKRQQKYKVHLVRHDIYIATETGGQMKTIVYYSKRLHMSEGPTPWCTNTTIIFPQRSKNVMQKPANKEGLLY
jgi:hypothetical protein